MPMLLAEVCVQCVHLKSMLGRPTTRHTPHAQSIYLLQFTQSAHHWLVNTRHHHSYRVSSYSVSFIQAIIHKVSQAILHVGYHSQCILHTVYHSDYHLSLSITTIRSSALIAVDHVERSPRMREISQRNSERVRDHLDRFTNSSYSSYSSFMPNIVSAGGALCNGLASLCTVASRIRKNANSLSRLSSLS